MNPTLASLIQNALDAKRHYEAEWGQHCPNDKLLNIYQENELLANNALEEAITNLIDTRIAKALNDVQP